MKKRQRDFEVIVPATDVLEKELQNVLGGFCDGDTLKIKCNGRDAHLEIKWPGLTDSDCPEGYIAVEGWCVPA